MVSVDVVWLFFSLTMGSWLTRDNISLFKYVAPSIYSLSLIPSPGVPVNGFIIFSVLFAVYIASLNRIS